MVCNQYVVILAEWAGTETEGEYHIFVETDPQENVLYSASVLKKMYM